MTNPFRLYVVGLTYYLETDYLSAELHNGNQCNVQKDTELHILNLILTIHSNDEGTLKLFINGFETKNIKIVYLTTYNLTS